MRDRPRSRRWLLDRSARSSSSRDGLPESWITKAAREAEIAANGGVPPENPVVSLFTAANPLKALVPGQGVPNDSDAARAVQQATVEQQSPPATASAPVEATAGIPVPTPNPVVENQQADAGSDKPFWKIWSRN